MDKSRSRDRFEPIKTSVEVVGKRTIGHRVDTSVNLGRLSLARSVIYVFDWLSLIFSYTRDLDTYFINFSLTTLYTVALVDRTHGLETKNPLHKVYKQKHF